MCVVLAPSEAGIEMNEPGSEPYGAEPISDRNEIGDRYAI